MTAPAPGGRTRDAREEIADWLLRNLFWGLDPSKKYDAADAILGLPGVADALAAAERVRAVADEIIQTPTPPDAVPTILDIADRIRRALDSPP